MIILEKQAGRKQTETAEAYCPVAYICGALSFLPSAGKHGIIVAASVRNRAHAGFPCQACQIDVGEKPALWRRTRSTSRQP